MAAATYAQHGCAGRAGDGDRDSSARCAGASRRAPACPAQRRAQAERKAADEQDETTSPRSPRPPRPRRPKNMIDDLDLLILTERLRLLQSQRELAALHCQRFTEMLEATLQRLSSGATTSAAGTRGVAPGRQPGRATSAPTSAPTCQWEGSELEEDREGSAHCAAPPCDSPCSLPDSWREPLPDGERAPPSPPAAPLMSRRNHWHASENVQRGDGVRPSRRHLRRRRASVSATMLLQAECANLALEQDAES